MDLDMNTEEIDKLLTEKDEGQEYYEETHAFRKDLYTRDPEDTSTIVRTIREPRSYPVLNPAWDINEMGDLVLDKNMTFTLIDYGHCRS